MDVWCLLPCVCSMGWLDDCLSRVVKKKLTQGKKAKEGLNLWPKKALARAHMFILFEQGDT